MAIGFTVSSPVNALRGVVKTLPVTLTADQDYTDVHINVLITSEPPGSFVALMATDTLGDTYDIAALGYWGPSSGFTIPAGYNATTDVSGIFSKTGNYVITLSLTAKDSSSNPVTPPPTVINVHVEDSDLSQKILVKRGLRANLPSSTTAFEMLYATDTRELFVANASGVPEKVVDVIVSATAPTQVVLNQLWLDTSPGSNMLKRWNGTEWVVLDAPSTGHNHDDRYYTETEIDAFLANKSDINHNHDARYYTKAQIHAMQAVIDGGSF